MSEHSFGLVPSSAVDAALNYADCRATCGKATGGYPNLWVSTFPSPSPGDRLIRFDQRTAGEGAPGTGTRPELCMQILAAEVRRLRSIARVAPSGLAP